MRKIFLLLFLFSFKQIFPIAREFVESVKIVKANSINQKIEDFNKVILEGEVEVWVDQKMHIWADRVEIDKEKQTLVAQKKGDSCSSVVIETNIFLILADKIFLNLDNKTGYADNIRIQVDQGYITASKAEKIGDNGWKMGDMVYSPCDSVVPHWSISARQARLYSNYFVRFTGVLFNVGKIPFFILPTMVLPLQNRSKSGFLLPKVSYDDELGFGVREDYYWSIAPRCDSTLGINWRQRKGIAFSDEFRWVRHPEKFTFLNGQFAIEKNAFIKKGDCIVKSTDQRFWVNGKDFNFFDIKLLPNEKLYSLLRIDFGTDKRIGYQFFDTTKGLDDTFCNSVIARTTGKKDQINLFFDSQETSRRQFSLLTQKEEKEVLALLPSEARQSDQWDMFSKKKEVEDTVTVILLPHLEWNTVYSKFKNLLSYRHDIFADQIFSRSKEIESFYVNSRAIKEIALRPLDKADTARFFYSPDLQANLKFRDQLVNLYFNPIFQLRSKIKGNVEANNKNYRLFLTSGAQWAFPESFVESQDGQSSYYFQPLLKWDFLSKQNQDSWYYSDKWDRLYPKNQLELYLRNNWYFNNLQIDLNIITAFDFYNKNDIFPLRRCPGQKHFLPPKFELNLGSDILNLFLCQEYNWRNFQLLQSQINFNFALGDLNLYLGTLYQHESLQKERELFSDIPHFVTVGFSVPLFKKTMLSYDGHFYSQKGTRFLPFEGLRSLSHAIRLEYNGHCWGVALGFEEKRYREYGNWKSENAYSLFVRLDSLGSFARKFKRPPIYTK